MGIGRCCDDATMANVRVAMAYALTTRIVAPEGAKVKTPKSFDWWVLVNRVAPSTRSEPALSRAEGMLAPQKRNAPKAVQVRGH
jgi:hypothetical protein